MAQSIPLIRPMLLADLDNVVSVEQVAHAYPWTRRMFVDSIEHGYECWVIEKNSEILGQAVLSIACGEAHLLTLGVAPIYQRQGLGRLMIERLLLRAKAERAEMVFLEVRASNIAAQKLYLSVGFNQIAERKNYYPASTGRENAIIFALHILNEN